MVDLPYPCLALIADGFTDDDRADRAVTAVEAGVRWVHLRDHHAGPEAFEAAARRLTERLRALVPDVTVSVNTRLGVAQELGTSLHLGRRGPSVADGREALGSDTLLGYSAHEEIGIEGDRAPDVDYYFFSPVYETSSKPAQPAAGISALRSFCRTAAPTPTLALGGISPERVQACREAGAQGVAVLSGIMEAEVPVAATRAYLRALGELA
ncbi:MAG: thiamine phosphate synthase [Salinibacter sp.]